MKVSARNVFKGVVHSITSGSVNDEVTLSLPGSDLLVAIVTHSSVKTLGLAVGKPAVGLVKAPWVIIGVPETGLTFSARNQLKGVVSSIATGGVNSEVGITLPGGNVVHSVVTNDAVKELGLAVGKPAVAVIKASHVILAVQG
jgi:molybdate transport system regulatory protein